MNGFLNILKPPGMTSHDVVAFLRKKLNTKKVGHLGTLDPAAAGVLPVALGKATRLIEYLEHNDQKQYLAEFIFGFTTTTGDMEGEILKKTDAAFLTKKTILEKLQQFSGEIWQMPPLASAVKVAGKPLYHYQRRGEQVEVPRRLVTIYDIELLDFLDENTPNPRIRVLIQCSRGTYIRSIAHDLGEMVSTGAALNFLLRTKSGPFSIENSRLLEEEPKIIPVEEAFRDFPRIILDEQQYLRVKNGREVHLNEKVENAKIYFAYFSGKLVATGQVKDLTFKPEKVLGKEE